MGCCKPGIAIAADELDSNRVIVCAYPLQQPVFLALHFFAGADEVQVGMLAGRHNQQFIKVLFWEDGLNLAPDGSRHACKHPWGIWVAAGQRVTERQQLRW